MPHNPNLPYEVIFGNYDSLILSQLNIDVMGGSNVVQFNTPHDPQTTTDLADVCQTFIPPNDCILSQIKVRMPYAPDGSEKLVTVTITIRPTDVDGHPTETILGTSILSGEDIKPYWESIPHTFYFGRVKLQGNIKYAFHIHVDFELGSTSVIAFEGILSETDNYLDGALVYQLPSGDWDTYYPTRNDDVSMNPGYRDLWFKIYEFNPKNEAKLYTTFDDGENKLYFTVEKPGYTKIGSINLS